MTDYTELIKALRDDNACLSIKTLHNAADAIEELSKELMELKMLTCCCCEPPKEET